MFFKWAMGIYFLCCLLTYWAGTRVAVGGEILIPRMCMTSIELMPNSECRGADEEHMRCTNLKLTVKKDCGLLTTR